MKKSECKKATVLTESTFGGMANHKRTSRGSWLARGLSTIVLGLGFVGAASAQDVYLQAKSYTKIITLPDTSTVTVPMWGFANCNIDFSACDNLDDTLSTTTDASGVVTTTVVQDSLKAGPKIPVDISAVGTSLTVHLKNDLTVPVSLVIPGQFGGGDPVKFDDASGRNRQRMRSMTHETLPGATGTYAWSSLKVGTYLYQSGTQPSLQVPMGLYGALTVVNGTDAYAGVAPNVDAIMLLSEVDPVQNERVSAAANTKDANGAYIVATEKCVPMADFKVNGTVGYPCTIDYNPLYMLVNGTTKGATPPQITDGSAAQSVLIRFLNAGLRSHTPGFAGLELGLVAEDGNLYPGVVVTDATSGLTSTYPRMQASALLTAGKTMDALVTAPANTTDSAGNTVGVTWSLYDHMSSFSNEADVNGTALASFNLGVGAPAVPAATIYAVEDSYTTNEDTSLTGASVLTNDVGLTLPLTSLDVSSKPANGSVTMNADGTFTYMPKPNFYGTDTFMYAATDTSGVYSALVTVKVLNVNDQPIAGADAYKNSVTPTITVDALHGLLGNDSDADGDTLTAVLPGAPIAGLSLSPDGSFTYSGGVSTTFQYTAVDPNGLASEPVTVTLTVTPPSLLNLAVKASDTGNLIDSYRWIVQEDNTYHFIDDANPQNTPVLNQQALNLHKSTMTVVATGCSNCSDASGATYADAFGQLALDPTKHYYVSVLPNDAVSFDPTTGDRLAGHTIGGAQISPSDIANHNTINVVVNPQEIPTAQISVEVFADVAPTNGANDGEPGLGGFTITLEDGGGRYGMSAGIMSQDTYGNPLKNSLDCFYEESGTTAQGAPYIVPTGVIETCPATTANIALGIAGHALIKNLAPGKYGVIALPPASEKSWVQTSTIEGTKIIDAWVKAGEPAYFNEFGLVGPHAFIGFTRPEDTCIGAEGSGCIVTGTPGTHTITGKVSVLHDPKPPKPMLSVDTGSWDILGASRAWVGLNSDGGIGPSIATIEAAEDGSFTIPNVPNGLYQVVIWDVYLDGIISFYTVEVKDADVDLTAGGTLTQGIPSWFTRSEHNVFLDDGCGGKPGDPGYGNGIRDICKDASGATIVDINGDPVMEEGLPDQAINIRWRDGTMNQSFPTDSTGFVPFDEAFPFFSWQLYEVDYLRYKPTGVTVTVDAAGPMAHGNTVQMPQIQDPALFTLENESCTPYTFPDGTVEPCGSRLETGPVLLEAFQSMPGQTNIYNWGKVPYQPGENGGIAGVVGYGTTRAENDPRLTVIEPWEPGIANVKVRLYGVIQQEDGSQKLSLIKEVTTDSWDAAPPAGCQAETDNTDPFVVDTLGSGTFSDATRSRCFDGFRNYNQSRPGVFDGGYAFMSMPNPKFVDATTTPNEPEEIPLPPGAYVVEVVPPTGYELYKEEDVNVTMGDARTGDTNGVAPVTVTLPNGSLIMTLPDLAMVEYAGKEPGLLQPPCVGAMHTVPAELSLFPGEPAPFAGSDRPLCNRKLVMLSDQGQAAADFHLFTTTPVAAQFTGLITNDISMETNPASPMMGEKFAPAYMPFTIRDHNGNVVFKGLGDGWGRYNGLIPSTFSANIPMPSGYSPAMMQACLNEPGATQDPRYTSGCVTGQFMPGTNTYLDTPILPQSAFAGGFNPPDCAQAAGTPGIAQVDGDGVGPFLGSGGTLTIRSMGMTAVPNPEYQGPLAAAPYNAPTVLRDYGFGSSGQVLIGGVDVTTTGATVTWGNDVITVANVTSGGQLDVINAAGVSSVNAVTVTVGNGTPIRVPGNYTTIQDAIDAADVGQLILVGPGVYNERVLMWKPVRLQGVGANTVIDALQTKGSDLEAFRAVVASHLDPAAPAWKTVDLLPGLLTFDDEGAGITVIGKNDCSRIAGPDGTKRRCFNRNPARIDGLTVTRGANAGGILVHAWADTLVISNNTVTANSGVYSGGIRLGFPNLPANDAPTGRNVVGYNTQVKIRNNVVALNGAFHLESAGAGISLNYGSNGYQVQNNFVCGNYTAGDGAGIGHLGVSNNGKILNNTILFNEANNVGFTTHGGGILIAGESMAGTLSSGSGDVLIAGNLIQGNHAASGSGAGIRLQYVNGLDVTTRQGAWRININNNKVVNNVAGNSGAGISLQNAVNVAINSNIVANNDTTATVGASLVYVGGAPSSTAQPSGIVAESHSLGLDTVLAGTGYNTTFSEPVSLDGNTLWHNAAFHLGVTSAGTNGLLAGTADSPVDLPVVDNIGDCAALDATSYQDLGVLGAVGALVPTNPVVVTSVAGEFCNGSRMLVTPYNPMKAYLGTGEGGNFVDVRFGPLVKMGSY